MNRVGSSLLERGVNDDSGRLMHRSALASIASGLAPTGPAATHLTAGASLLRAAFRLRTSKRRRLSGRERYR